MHSHSSITLSYVWIGDNESSAKSRMVAGHDTQGPIMMAERVGAEHRIKFFCLDQQAAYYADIFRSYHIKVVPIRKFLSHCAKKSEAAAKVMSVMDDLLKPGRNTVRDRVTVKNILSLYILMTIGDYYLDTNVRPSAQDALSLIRRDTYCAPNVIKQMKKRSLDVWMMFSPPQNNFFAVSAFNYFFTHLKNAEEEIYAVEAYSNKYHVCMGSLIVDSIAEVAKVSGDQFTHWDAYVSADGYLAEVFELGVDKYYFNTHKFESRAAYDTEDSLLRNQFVRSLAKAGLGFFSVSVRNTIYDYLADHDGVQAIRDTYHAPAQGSAFSEIFYVVINGNIKRLEELISLGEDINQQLTGKIYSGATPLHFAILNKRLLVMEILLQNGANVNLVAKNKDVAVNGKPYDLIMAMPENVRAPFLELYEKFHSPIKISRIFWACR